MVPTELAVLEFTSGVPTVRKLELGTGGAHEPDASGGP
jgi:hypothetical protein